MANSVNPDQTVIGWFFPWSVSSHGERNRPVRFFPIKSISSPLPTPRTLFSKGWTIYTCAKNWSKSVSSLEEDLDRSIHLSTLFLVRCSPLSGWAYSFPRNWQVPFLNQQKGENDHQKYFIITLHERKLPDPVWIKPVTSWSPARPASGCATEPSTYRTKGYNKILSTFKDYLIIILR